MYSLRKGVMRAVRLLPDVVKIGVEPETALPSSKKEEQLLDGEKASEISESNEDTRHIQAAEPLKELQSLIAALETQLNDAKAREQNFTKKISSMEAELSASKSAFVQKEHELAQSVSTAREQARTEGREQGRDEGLQKGYDEGVSKAKAEVEGQYREKFSSLVTALEGVSTKLEEQFSELVALNQPRMLRLWSRMLSKMLHREMALAPDAVFKVLADVLSRLSDKNHVLIYVSPDDMKLLEEKLQGEFGDILRGVKHLELKPDAHVDKGSCLVETNLGIYDARWRTQFDQIDSAVDSLFQKLGKTPQQKAKKKKKTEGAEDA